MKKVFFILTAFFAIEGFGAIGRNEIPVGARPLGMGGAFLALADDDNVLWYNPAQLADINDVHISLFDFSLGADSLETYGTIYDAIIGGDLETSLDTDYQFLNFRMAPSFLFPYFGFSFYSDFKTHSYFEDIFNPFGEVDIFSVNDIGLIAGIGVPIGRYISIGGSARAFQRFSADVATTTAQLALDMGVINPNDIAGALYQYLVDNTSAGFGVGVNASMMVKIPFDKRRNWARLTAVLENLGGVNFSAFGTTGNAPDPIPMKYNLGGAVQYQTSRKTQIRLAADWRDILGGNSLSKTMHLGMELLLPGFDLRFGVMEGWPTFGFTFRLLPHTRVHFSSFARERTNSIWGGSARRYLVQLVIGFDPL